jgi:hypothetical protein
MIQGHSQKVAFDSSPVGAVIQVRDDPKLTCVTPCALDVERSSRPKAYKATKLGYEPYSGELTSLDDFRGGLLLPVIVDGILIIPGIIDIAGDVFYDYPKRVELTLPKEGSGGSRAETFW